MVRILASLLLAHVATATAEARAWPITLQKDSETMPVIEVGLAPPANPFPEVSGVIDGLEKARGAAEEEKMAKLEEAYNAALVNARGKIEAAVGSAMHSLEVFQVARSRSSSFLALKSEVGRLRAGEGPSVSVKVLPAAAPASSIKSQLEVIEAKRNNEEAQIIDQAITKMGELTDIVVAELKASLQEQVDALLVATAPRGGSTASFLEKEGRGMQSEKDLSEAANVRVVTAEIPYPTIAGLVQEMETRRDAAENLERQKILALEQKLLEAEHAMIKEALASVSAALLQE